MDIDHTVGSLKLRAELMTKLPFNLNTSLNSTSKKSQLNMNHFYSRGFSIA